MERQTAFLKMRSDFTTVKAPVGQTRAHFPQSVHFAASTTGASKPFWDRAKVFKCNVDQNPETASRYGITGIPTVIVFRNGAVEKQLVGVQSETAYLDALQ